MTRREPEWDAEQQALMLALDMNRRLTCENGHYLPESTDPASEGHWQVEGPVLCHACEAIGATAQTFLNNRRETNSAPHFPNRWSARRVR